MAMLNKRERCGVCKTDEVGGEGFPSQFAKCTFYDN